MQETWKDVPNYEGLYQASSLGRIKSVSRLISNHTGKRTIPETILAFKVNRNGYYVCNLYKNGKRKDCFVHVLIAHSFIGFSNLQVDHDDNNKLNNVPSNLKYLTARDNCIKRSMLLYKTSRFPNVHWHKHSKKWCASIRLLGTRVHIGYYSDEEKACKAVIDVLDEIHDNRDASVTASNKAKFCKV